MGDVLPLDTAAVLPALLAGAAAATVVAALVRPAPRLAPRLRPYNSPNRVRLGKPADLQTTTHGQAALSGGALAALFAPMLAALVRPLTRLVGRDGDDALTAALRHAGVHPDLPADERVAAWRRRQLITAAAALAGTLALALVARSALLAAAAPLGAYVFGAVLPKARLERLTDTRRERMRIELYTVNQQLAMYQQTAGGVHDALQRLTARMHCLVADELTAALRWHRAGMPLPAALHQLADTTAEPFAARTYKALAKAADTGAPIGGALLHLSTDVQAARLDALQRLATRRQATMLVPMVVLLIPPLLILTGAPVLRQLFSVAQ